MRIAYFSPLNPIESGISDYSEELLPHLARYAEVELFIDDYEPSNTEIAANFPLHSYRDFRRLRKSYDVTLYQMGNSPAHAYMYSTLLKCPGVVVLHDFVLHHLFAWLAFTRGEKRTYVREMEYCYSKEGASLARQVINGGREINFFDYPLSNHVIDAGLRVIVHSNYVKGLVKGVNPSKPVRKINMGVPLLDSSLSGSEAKAKLGLHPDRFVIASFGHMNPYKRLDVILRAYKAFSQRFPDSLYVLVGSSSPEYDVEQAIWPLGLEDRVIVAGRPDNETFHDYIAAADLCVSLRYPTAGETSASVLRIMGAGKPVLVSRAGSFAELPDDACGKVDVDETEEALLLEYMLYLAAHEDVRRQMGRNARRYIREHHSLDQAARSYVDFLEAISSDATHEGNNHLGQNLMTEVAAELADLGIFEKDEPVLHEVASAIEELDLIS